LRRRCETVSQIPVVVSTKDDHSKLVDHFLRFPLVTRVNSRTESRGEATLVDGVRTSITVVSPAQFWTTLMQETGSDSHLEKVAAVATSKGFTLGEEGLRRPKTPAAKIRPGSEADIYQRLGMQYVPAELREDQGEVEAALAGKLPTDLVAVEDIQGMVHCHTLYSDGKNSVEEMALAAQAMGMKYITITDHSPTAFYAGGVKLDRLKRQWEEISLVQERVKVKLLRGTESDILADGALDYPDRILEKFDVIIASIHSRMKMDEDQMTRRLVAAMKQPVFKIWGHALGRLLQRRPPFACRVEEVLDAVAESRVAVEINGDPHRLDMEPRWVREARKRGIRFVISTDAHSVGALQNISFGVAMARRGWVRRGEVLNTFGLSRFLRTVRPAA
jgi:DNA polymerase (family 10)